MKIAIIVDSSSNLSLNEAKKLGWYLLPMTITIDGKEYIDGVDINSSMFNQIYKNSSIAKTSATNIQEIKNMYDKLSKEYDKIVVYPISKHLSSQYANFKLLSNDYDNVYVVESHNICEHIVFDLLAFQDKKIETEKQFIEEFNKLGTYKSNDLTLLIPKSNEPLVKGGRLSPAAAALAKVLKIVPVISFDGELKKYDKSRIFDKTVSKYIKLNLNKSKSERTKIILLHSHNNNIEKVRDEFIGQINHEYFIPCTVAIHTGIEAIAIINTNVDEKYINILNKLRQNNF
ncbi:DegV family protein [Mycoplasma phocimorsus]|uniref:DegV family protein n=1 Tax=Mycoplasma phocimorsus TaxID=3045839 RepID=UPI0024C0A68E|nr:DegV family protein [Mycoplasma phocimorsus]MDJ1646450.1 DegV family protein [Mycoplasma phocimorsus]MDJ1648860.1 DegV family protein [Mycoplasma phocimorsus]